MEGAAQERWAGGWPVGPKALAAQQVTEGLQAGSAGEDLGNSTSRRGVSWWWENSSCARPVPAAVCLSRCLSTCFESPLVQSNMFAGAKTP